MNQFFNWSLEFDLETHMAAVLAPPETIITLALCFFVLVANLVSIVATAHGPQGMNTHMKLIVSLALSDMLISLTCLCHILSKLFNPVKLPMLYLKHERLTSSCLALIIGSLNNTAHLISLLNLVAMALDHYIAIIKPLHYNVIMNKKRGVVLICGLWTLAAVGGFSTFLSGIGTYRADRDLLYCEYIVHTDFQAEYVVFASTFLSLFAIMLIYGRIYYEIKKVQTYMTANTKVHKSRQHNKKALLTTLIIIGTFIICWMPFCLFQIAMIIQVEQDEQKVWNQFSSYARAHKYLYALLLLNSLCDPVIYAVRLSNVQIGYKRCWLRCQRRLCFRQRNNSRTSSMVLERRNTETATGAIVIESDDGLYIPQQSSLIDSKVIMDEDSFKTNRGML